MFMLYVGGWEKWDRCCIHGSKGSQTACAVRGREEAEYIAGRECYIWGKGDPGCLYSRCDCRGMTRLPVMCKLGGKGCRG